MQDPNADGHMLSITHTAEACNSNCDGVDDAPEAKSVYCVGTLKVRYHKNQDGAMVGEETTIALSEESKIDDLNVSTPSESDKDQRTSERDRGINGKHQRKFSLSHSPLFGLNTVLDLLFSQSMVKFKFNCLNIYIVDS